jgi:hypothetical protein
MRLYYTRDGFLSPTFSILNTHANEFVKVGAIIGDKWTPNVTATIIYPGGVTNQPADQVITIPFSWAGMNNLEITGDFVYFSFATNMAAMIGFNEIMFSQEVLPQHQLLPVNLSVGIVVWLPEIAEIAYVNQMNNLGTLLFGPINTDISDGLLMLERKYDKLLPKIFAWLGNTKYSDPDETPLFNRVAITNKLQVHGYLKLFKVYNWTKTNMLGSTLLPSVDMIETMHYYFENN